jgi:hypothetical protein
MTATYPYPLDAQARVSEVIAAIESAREDIDGWIHERQNDGHAVRFGRFERHFSLLQEVLGLMLDAIAHALAAETESSEAAVFTRCRSAERRVGKVRETFRWYATKYEQRLDPGLSVLLLAADEVVRSCFDPPFLTTGQPRPTAPLCFLDDRFDPAATPRHQPPPGIPAGDEVVGEFVRRLPVPTIALPLTCLDKPWWLAVIAHEVGHHVYFDLAGAPRRSRTCGPCSPSGPR